MATYMLNALTLRHDHDAAERTLHHFWDTKDLFDSSLIEEHIASQPLLAATLFSLLACSLGLVVFAVVFLACRLRGQCGSQKYQEYPSNSTNYAVYLMLFFVSWIIVTSASAYFVLAGAGFWSEKLDARRPIPKFTNSSIVRLSRSSAIGELFANYDYHGDFESVTERPAMRRVHIRRQPIQVQTFRKRIEIPMRPLAEVTFNGPSSRAEPKAKQAPPPDDRHRDELIGKVVDLEQEQEEKEEEEETEDVTPEDVTPDDVLLVVTGDSMRVEEAEEYEASSVEEEEEEDTTTTTTSTTTTTTTLPTTTTTTSTTTTVPTTTTTTQLFPELTWKEIKATNTEDVLDQLLSATSSENLEDRLDYTPPYTSNHVFFSLHSRFLVFICRLTFCLVTLALATVILPTFFLVVAGTGCYIYSEHPMNRSSVSNKVGQVVSVNASILLFVSPCMLTFSCFTLFYTHCHELLCATIQLQHQQAIGKLDVVTSSYSSDNHQSLLETYSLNVSHCSRSLAPVQSLMLASLLLAISLLPCVFAMFKLVKYYFRMSSEFYWNAADNFAGRQFSKQQEIPRYQSTVIYPDDELTAGYAVYGQI